MSNISRLAQKISVEDIASMHETKVRRLEARDGQKFLMVAVYGPPFLLMFSLLMRYSVQQDIYANTKALLFVIPAAVVLAIVVVYLGPALRRYTITSRRAKIQGWLLQTAVVAAVGIGVENWWVSGTVIAISTLAQSKRPTYDKFENAIMLWEPDNKTSVYFDFAEAKRAAEML